MTPPRVATHWGIYQAARSPEGASRMLPIASDESPSPIGDSLLSALEGPGRITKPAIRRGWLKSRIGNRASRGDDTFVSVPWDEALGLAAEALNDVKSEYGNDAIYGSSSGWGSAGRFHHAQSQIHRFLSMFGGFVGSRGTYSAGAMEVVLPYVIGGSGYSIRERGPLWDEIRKDGELVVSFGGLALRNTQVNPGGVGSHVVPRLVSESVAAGVRFVNVSPVSMDSPHRDAEWIPIRPATDTAMMLGIAHHLVVSDMHDAKFLKSHCTGFEEFEEYLRGRCDGVPKSAEWAESISTVPATTIKDLAERIAHSRTVINVSLSVQRAQYGEHVHWMAAVLAAMSGSFGKPGGGFAAGLGTFLSGSIRRRTQVASLVQPENPVQKFIPVSRVADMLLEPGGSYEYNGMQLEFPKIKLIYWIGGNPFHHHQDLNRLVRAWRQPETVITNESWWTPLAKFSDIVFPVAAALERNDIAAGMMDKTLTASMAVSSPPPGVVTDYDVFRMLADRLGFGEQFSEGRSADEWVSFLYEETRHLVRSRHDVELPEFSDFWRLGETMLPDEDDEPLRDFARFRANARRWPLSTPSGRIEIVSERVRGFGYEEFPGYPVWREPDEWLGSQRARTLPLHLLSPQPTWKLHSQYDNGALSRSKKVDGREVLLMHRGDAATRGISDGDLVKVFNERGACLAVARLVEDIVPQVVVLPTGAWFDPSAPGARGAIERHGNPNVLTGDGGTSRLAQGPAPGTTLVDVSRYVGRDPGVFAFEPPRIV